jgi:hypothetical protein
MRPLAWEADIALPRFYVEQARGRRAAVAEVDDDHDAKGGGTRAKGPPEATVEHRRIAGLLVEINRILGPEPDRAASLETEINRLLDDFDD